MGGGQSPLSPTPSNPSLVGGEVPVQGENVKDATAARVVLGADSAGYRSLEGFEGKDGDLL